MSSDAHAEAASAAVRTSLVAALEADLVGPYGGDPESGELLTLAPSRWYLTGFLAPAGDRETGDATSEDELGAGSDEDDDDAEAQEPEPKQTKLFPASIGLSVLLPPSSSGPGTVRATVRFADYERVELPRAPDEKRKRHAWRRHPRTPAAIDLPLDRDALAAGFDLPDAPQVRVVGELDEAEAPGLPPGTRALSLFVVNERPPAARDDAEERARADERFLFQVSLELEHGAGLLPRPNRTGEGSIDHDDAVADLQFRNRHEWAVGHGVSVEVVDAGEHPVRRVRTSWLPRHEVRRVVTHDEPGVELGMEALSALEHGAALRHALGKLPEAYGAWVDAQARIDVGSPARSEVRDTLVHHARRARDRIADGLARVASEPALFEAFRLANLAMASSARQRSPSRYGEGKAPAWRLFQLAFVLLNVAGIDDEHHPDRDDVELIYFPTGGGKTEAYLGVIAFTLCLRRLRGRARPDGGLGVAVLLRYTLRLLTLDQLGRAATLVCALEVLRGSHPGLGSERFAVGLWVGRSATANTLEQAKRQLTEYKAKSGPSPFPLVSCPWCGAPIEPAGLTLEPSPSKAEGVVAACVKPACEFNARRRPEGLPVLFVDEQIYRELPSFLVATVDKFAMLPWRGETGMLFGRVTARAGRRFFGPATKDSAKAAVALPEGLRPPELVVQDELHLISGPLGTMVGLYETAIDYLCTRTTERGAVRPKIIASTATVRRAQKQIRALFGRRSTAVFPPPMVDHAETWFATVAQSEPGRLYVGVAAQGRALKGILLRTYVALLCAGERHWDKKADPKQPADPYMTLAGYFNSLRELGGMRRLVEDDVRLRAANVEARKPIDFDGRPALSKNRSIQLEPVELTSRESTAKIKAAKDRLEKLHADKEHVDVLLASNMISVGVDIDRLGLMVIAGQPKTTAEYIQASSRVGRAHPGLVVTCFNLVRPRDRSHYERFDAYHESFYRFVEATSVTPFSGPAIHRGLAGTLVAMARLTTSGLTPPTGLMHLREHRAEAERAVRTIAERAAEHAELSEAEAKELHDALAERAKSLLDAWQSIVDRSAHDEAGKRRYSGFEQEAGAGRPLLYTADQQDPPLPGSDEERFYASTSMRDVEESAHLWLERRALGGGRR